MKLLSVFQDCEMVVRTGERVEEVDLKLVEEKPILVNNVINIVGRSSSISIPVTVTKNQVELMNYNRCIVVVESAGVSSKDYHYHHQNQHHDQRDSLTVTTRHRAFDEPVS